MWVKELELNNWQKHTNLKLQFINGVNYLYGSSDAGKCLTGDTLIPNPIDGKLYSIEDLIVNPSKWKVWNIDKNYQLKQDNIIGIVANGIKDVFLLKTSSGREIKCTNNHKFFSEDLIWKDLKNFKVGDLIAVPNKILNSKVIKNISISEAKILGYFLGDGCILRNCCPNFTNADKDIINDLLYHVEKQCGKHHINVYIKSHNKAKTYSFSKPLFIKNRNIGASNIQILLEKFKIRGTESHTKFIPEEIFTCSDEIIGYFLGALFNCDGFVPNSTKSLEYCSVSKKMIYQYHHLLLRLGIISRVFEGYKSNQSGKKFKYYGLVISTYKNIKKFSEKIFLIGKKQDLLLKRVKVCQNMLASKHDTLPIKIARFLDTKLRKCNSSGKSLRQRIGLNDKKGYLYLKHQSFNRVIAEKIVSFFKNKKLNNLVNNDIYWDKIIKIEYHGKKPTYDLQILNNHNFIANDFYVHNSCIRRAISWVFDLESYNEETIRKEGSKKTSVRVLLNNGVEIERVRSSSINRFITRVPGQKELEYDAVGKGAPEEVKKLLQLSLIKIDDENKLNLNIAEQISMPFLTDLKASTRFKLFNKLTGNDLLDIIVGKFNKEIFNINRDLKVQEEIIIANEPQVKFLKDEIETKKIVLNSVTENLKILKEEYQKYLKLQEIQTKLSVNRTLSANAENSIKILKSYDEKDIISLKTDIDKYLALNKLKIALFRCKEQLEDTQSQLNKIKVTEVNSVEIKGQINKVDTLKTLLKGINTKKEELNTLNQALNRIKVVEINFPEIRANIHKLEQLNRINKGIFDNLEKSRNINVELNKLNEIIPLQEKEYTDILKEAKICPVCKQDTNGCEIH